MRADKKDIRFIDIHYNTIFKIPDGSYIEITERNGEKVIKACQFIDEYHTRVGYNIFHICEFAELMKRKGATYQKEPVLTVDKAAWKINSDKYLVIQTCDDGYDYTIFDSNLKEIDGGQLDMPECSMLEIRNEILSSYNIRVIELRAMEFEVLMECTSA